MTILDYLSANMIEFLGFLFGVIYVILAIRENFWCWIAGLVNVVMYIIVFYEQSLYGMMGLQVIYLFMSFYGLFLWSGLNKLIKLKGIFPGIKNPEVVSDEAGRKNIKEVPQITRMPAGYLWFVAGSIVVCTLIAGYFLTFTDNEIPWMDGLITAMGLAATWMTARKYIENWLVWIVNDLICVFLYFYLGLYLTAAFYIILFTMAIVGYFEWKKKTGGVQ